jgi:hypothetical protein
MSHTLSHQAPCDTQRGATRLVPFLADVGWVHGPNPCSLLPPPLSSFLPLARLTPLPTSPLPPVSSSVRSFISAQDLDRKEKYAAVELLLRDLEGVVNAAGAASAGGGGSESGEGSERLGGDGGGGGSSGGAGSGAGGGRGSAGGQGLGAYSERLSRLRATLSELRAGASGGARRALEAEMQFELREIGAETRGEAEVAKGYCGSCHGAAEEGRCCNTCEEVGNRFGGRGECKGHGGGSGAMVHARGLWHRSGWGQPPLPLSLTPIALPPTSPSLPALRFVRRTASATGFTWTPAGWSSA